MLTENPKLGVTDAGNYQAPTQMDCISWVAQAWKELKTCGVVKKAKELGMTPYPGAAIEGYVERNFEDPIPNSREADVYIAELERDFNKDEE